MEKTHEEDDESSLLDINKQPLKPKEVNIQPVTKD